MKKLVRLTESDLHKIVKESVNKVLKEDIYADNTLAKMYGLLEDALKLAEKDYFELDSINEPADSSYRKTIESLYREIKTCLDHVKNLGKGEDGLYKFDRNGRTPYYQDMVW